MSEHLLREMRVRDLPLLELDAHPESVDAEGDHRKQKPADPHAEELRRGAIEPEPIAVDHRVARLPAIDHGERPRIADAQRKHGDKRPQDVVAHQLEQPAVEV